MATQPTQNPVPSESPRDLKFNAGKIDEFATSMAQQYQDRFGDDHYTIEGLRWLAQQAIAQYGYITVDSFQAGASVTLPNQVLRDTSTGEYYRWDGALPKVVPANSTPQSTGGVGKGSWISVGDASLRTNLMSPNEGMGDALVTVRQPFEGAVPRTQHDKNTDSLSVKDFGAKIDGVTDDTAAFQAAAAIGQPVFIPSGSVSLSAYVDGLFWASGEITFTSTGHAPYALINKKRFDAMFTNFREKMSRGDTVSITCFGDSTTEGIGSTGWSGRPAGNATSISPAGAYPIRLQGLLQEIHDNTKIAVNNAGVAGKQILDGWAYNNYATYAKNIYGVSDVVIIAFGLNDVYQTSYTVESFRAQYEKLIYLIIKDKNVLPILMTPNSTIQATQRHTAIIKSAAEVVKDVAAKFGIPVIDQLYWQNMWLQSSHDPAAVWNTVQPDFIHFNDIGYMFMASVVAKELSPIVAYNTDKYARYPAWAGKLKNRRGSGFGKELGYFRPINNAFGVTMIWDTTTAQANDNIVDMWIWNDKPIGAIRYHSVNHDGWLSTSGYAAWPLLTVYAKSYSPDIVHSQETVAGAGQGVQATNLSAECSQLLGSGGFGRAAPFGLVRLVYTIRANPLSGGAFFGYFSVSDHAPRGKETVTANDIATGNGSNLVNTMPFDPTTDLRIGFGVDGNTTRMRMNGKMPLGTGVVIMESAVYSTDGSDASNLRTGFLISRTAANRVSLRPVVWNSGTGITTVLGVETLGGTWTDFSSTDYYNFTVTMVRTQTTFSVKLYSNDKSSLIGDWTTGIGNFIGSTGGYPGSIFTASNCPANSYAEHHFFIQ